ncbi:Alcohol dehydrogenase [Cladobotryum mycophilum]|uniref:Alcohol dehydrogenase n=1 Tax=Cladobotryum mycophilum TaxID=491253 RepID=A0ABR0T498_9HYPO
MPSFTVFKGTSDGVPKQSITEKPDTLTGDYVLVKITASGVCGTDLHYKHADMVLGHEGVGVVEEVGPDAKFLKKGDRVGWGYEVNSCGNCLDCLSGAEIYCKKREVYGAANFDQGSFGSHAIWREAFLHPIPDSMSDESAAPLQCGGATVFSALHDVNSNETVGVMGVGGLGHLAIQYAAKLGCRVVVLSGSDRKKDDATMLGAHKFITTNDGISEQLENEWLISRLLVTTSAQPAWDAIMPLMATRSRIYPLTASRDNLIIPYSPLLSKGIAVQGSLVASRAIHRKMIEFAALHDIKPVVEKFPMTEEGIKDAIERLESGKIHYRAVLVAQ